MCRHLGLSIHLYLHSLTDIQEDFENLGLPDYIEVAMHIAFGWPAIGTIKSARVPLEYMLIQKTPYSKGFS